jgi:hypothetical protein
MPIPLAAWIALAAGVQAQSPAITGEYMEDRTMRVYACPCEWSTDWAHRGREAVLAWNIQSGEFDSQSLGGLRIAVVLVGDFSLTEEDSPRRSAIYVDEAAPTAQRRAGVHWLRSRYSGLLGRVVAERDFPITFDAEPASITLAVGSILTLRMHRTDLPTEARSWAELIHDPFIKLSNSSLTTTSQVRYSGQDLNIRWTREEDAITGYVGNFVDENRMEEF